MFYGEFEAEGSCVAGPNRYDTTSIEIEKKFKQFKNH